MQVKELHTTSKELALKMAYLNSAEAEATLELELCPLLMPPAAWAAGKGMFSGGGSKSRAEGMLKFSDALIHKPLCQLERLAPEAASSKKVALADVDRTPSHSWGPSYAFASR